MALDLDQLGRLIVEQLTPDLLSPKIAESPAAKNNPLYGHCYVASEALYHLAGAKGSGLRPCRLKMGDGQWHWWLVDRDQRVIDLTAGQFAELPEYESGKRGAFLSKRPSARARKLMGRVFAASIRRYPRPE
jgi:hypothetical protein